MRSTYVILFHLIGSICAFGVLLWGIFYVYLPSISYHRETVTVPHLTGMHINEVKDFLSDRALSFKVAADSDFATEYPPLSVLKQIPPPGAQIKIHRNIIVTLNTTRPPSVSMPNLVDGSVKNAQMLLKANRLGLGKISYVDDLARNAVIAQYWKGNEINASSPILQGEVIDLDVGNGLGNQNFSVPNLVGIHIQEAEIIVISSGLRVGHKSYKSEGKQQTYRKTTQGDSVLIEEKIFTQELVMEQFPKAGTQVRIGDYLDLWISGEGPLSPL